MLIRRLKLKQFRNYQEEELCWDEQVNLLYGENAQGKSNLLEAICYLGIASSFRGAREQELIRHEDQHFYLEADIESEAGGKLRITAAANREGKRVWTVNGDHKQRLVDIVGIFHTVVFAPEDIYLIKSGPDARRRYINRQMSQADRAYCRLLMQYNHILKQRNALLKIFEHKGDYEQLQIWNEQLVAAGSEIMVNRAHTVKLLMPLAAEIHANLSGGERLEIFYHSQVAAQMREFSREQATELFAQALAKAEKREIVRGTTLAGPHRDDLIIHIDGREARNFASQGQQRTAALALKLAELELARQLRGEYPTLLLDDVFSELDMSRKRQIMALAVDKTQTFISAVEEIALLNAGKRWKIENGHVKA